MPTERLPVDLVVRPEIDASTCYAIQRCLMAEVGAGRRAAALFVFGPDRERLAIGRFHAAPPTDVATLLRRCAGGRVLPFGPGHLGLSLIVPRRDALALPAAEALSAPQVLNRHVRGFLHACRTLGVEPIYPGRDVVTIGRRIAATVGLVTEPDGVTCFEMVIAGWRSFAGLGDLLRRVDPESVLTVALPSDDEVTDVERELGRPLAFETAVDALRAGFERQLATRLEESGVEETAAGRFGGSDALDAWLRGRGMPPAATHRGSHVGAGGALDVYLTLRDGTIDEIVVSGDFLAAVDTVGRLETALRGCSLDAAAIDRAIADACSQTGDFLLGVEPISGIRDAVLRGTPL